MVTAIWSFFFVYYNCPAFERFAAVKEPCLFSQMVIFTTPEYTYQRNETVFFPQNSTDFVSQKLLEEIQNKMVYFYSVINEYSLHSRDVHYTPSWPKWSDFEYRPWCLAIVVR